MSEDFEVNNINTADTLGVMRFLSRQKHITWVKAIAETIDNSFDAGASFIRIEIKKTKGASLLRITDDGRGCRQPSVMVSPGHRNDHDTTELGRNGVGLKDALAVLCGESHRSVIRTVVQVGKDRRLIIYETDWDRARKTGDIRANVHTIAAKPDQIGTTIEASPVQKGLPELGMTIERLGYLYSPALRAGKRITLVINGREQDAQPWSPPEFVRYVEREFSDDGRRFRIKLGLVAPGVANKHYGLTFVQGFRVVEESPGSGLGDADTSRVCGIVELLEGFVLDKNKSGLLDAESEHVESRTLGDDEIIGLLKEAGSQAHDLTLEMLRDEATSMLNKTLGLAEPNRKAIRRGVKNPGSGTVEGTGNGSKHRRANRTQPGRTFGSAHRGSLKLVFVNQGEDHLAVKADSRSGNVAFNTSHPRFSAFSRSPEVIVTAAIVAWAVAVAGHDKSGAQVGLVTTDEVFSTIDRILRASVTFNGSEVYESKDAAE